ncbi:MAG: hypothetical protein QNK27_10245 [Desulfuromusa sp.]|nr:hypothetical protein [Desulfuromusa sp.]
MSKSMQITAPDSFPTINNLDGMEQTLQALDKINHGLIMTNLIDFDMLYGHRLDSTGWIAPVG